VDGQLFNSTGIFTYVYSAEEGRGEIFRQDKKILPCYLLFDIVIEALNLVYKKIFSRNSAAWQYHSASLYTTEF
jgi:hypothetical protein